LQGAQTQLAGFTHKFVIGKQGLEIGDKLEGLTGILGWTALLDDTPR